MEEMTDGLWLLGTSREKRDQVSEQVAEDI